VVGSREVTIVDRQEGGSRAMTAAGAGLRALYLLEEIASTARDLQG